MTRICGCWINADSSFILGHGRCALPNQHVQPEEIPPSIVHLRHGSDDCEFFNRFSRSRSVCSSVEAVTMIAFAIERE